jgi:hypothetical protein
MILNNYKLLKKAFFDLEFSTTQSSSENLTSDTLALTTSGNAVKIMVKGATGSAGNALAAADTQRGIYTEYMRLNKIDAVSLSSAAITEDATDYALSNEISSGLTITNLSNTSAAESTGFKNTITLVGYNSGDSNITIYGYGLKKNIRYFTDSSSYQSVISQPVLVAEGNLSNPITVAPNEYFTINIEWNEG